MNSTAELDYPGVAVVTIDEVRALAITLPRTTEAVVRGRVKFRVGRIVYLAFSRDETLMGFAFPKEWRDALVESEPDKFMLPRESDLRYKWAVVRLAAIAVLRPFRAGPLAGTSSGPATG